MDDTRELTREESSSSTASVGRCGACGCLGPNPGLKKLSVEQALSLLETLSPASMWTISADGLHLSRKFTCRNWQAAMRVIEQISELAERRDIQHHPDLHLTQYRDIEVVLSTHAAKGLTEHDFKLARLIDELKVDFSPKWLRAHPRAASAQLQTELAVESHK